MRLSMKCLPIRIHAAGEIQSGSRALYKEVKLRLRLNPTRYESLNICIRAYPKLTPSPPKLR